MFFGLKRFLPHSQHTLLCCLLGAALAGCSDGGRSGQCFGDCNNPGGPELFGPADDGDWTSFRNGALRSGVAVGGVLGSDVRVAWQQDDFLVLDYSAVKPSGVVWGDDLLFPSDDGSMAAFNRFTGERLWRTHLSNHSKGIHGSPVVANAAIWIGTYSGIVHALDRESGEEVYRFSSGSSIGSSPIYVAEHDAVYVSHESYEEGHGRGYVTRNDPRTGEALWTSARIPHFPHSSVAVAAQAELVLVGANDGVMRAYDTTSGQEVWSRDFEPDVPPDDPSADIKTTPAISPQQGLVIFGTWDHNVYALDLETGDIVWQVDTGGRLMGSAAIHEGINRVYVGTGRGSDALFAIELDTGDVVWTQDLGGSVHSSPAVNDAGDGLVVGSNDARVYGINAADGTITWSYLTDGAVTSSPAWVGSMIYVASRQGALYALETLAD